MLRGGADFFAEAAHVGIHSAGIDEGIVFPDIAEELVAGLDASGALGEDGEELEFGGSEVDGLAFPRGDVAGDIDMEIAEAELVAGFFAGLAAAEDFLDAQEEFARAERFGEVIISAEFEAEDAVDLGRLGGEHEDGRLGGGGLEAEGFANLEAVHFREHDIEDDEVGGLGAGFFEGLGAVGGGGYGITGLLEVELDEFNGFRFIIYN